MGLDPISIVGMITGGLGLLGGGGDSGSVKTGSSLNPEQTAIAQLLTSIMSSGLNSNIDRYTPQGTNELSTLLQSAIGNSNGVYDSSKVSNVFNNAVKPAATKTFKEQTLPTISESFVGPGTFWGGERAKAEAAATTDFNDSLNQVLSNMLYQDFNDTQNRSLQWGNLGAGVGGALASQDYSDYLRTQPENSPYLQAALSFLGTPMMYSYLQQPNAGLGPGLLQLAGNLIGAGQGKKG